MYSNVSDVTPTPSCIDDFNEERLLLVGALSLHMKPPKIKKKEGHDAFEAVDDVMNHWFYERCSIAVAPPGRVMVSNEPCG